MQSSSRIYELFGLSAVFGIAVSAPLSLARAQLPFQADSILLSTDNTLYEYSLDGVQRSSRPIPLNSGAAPFPGGEQSRDLIVVQNEQIAVYNGTFVPWLSQFDGSGWWHETIPGWSTVNNGSYGGIASRGYSLFLADMLTYNGGEERGIVVLDAQTYDYERILTANEYTDLTMGLDGLLYALRNEYGALDVIDPDTHELLRSVALGHLSGSRGVAADEDGTIYMVSWDDYVASYTPDGLLIKSVSLGYDPFDIDINADGIVILGGRFGDVYVTDKELSTPFHFTVGDSPVFVAFASGPVYVGPPQVVATHTVDRARVTTNLTWTTDAEGVDIYLNGQRIATFNTSEGSASYTWHKKLSQVYQVCNQGTQACSAPYAANP